MPDRSILITGASSGIGLASTLRLSSMGFRVFAGILPGEDLSALTDAQSERIVIVPIDITLPETISQAHKVIMRTAEDTGLYGLFNNAGIGISGPMEFMPIPALEKQLDVNLIGHVRVTQTFLPLIRKATGRIVNTASILGRISVPMGGPYSMSKYALEAFTEVLRAELRSTGIKVSAIEPGTIATPIWAKTQANADEMLSELPPQGKALYGDSFTTFSQTVARQSTRGISPDEVAKAVAKAFTEPRPRARYVVGADAKAMSILRHILPDRLFEWAVNRLYPVNEH